MKFDSTAPFYWDDNLLVGQGQMDDEHKEFVTLIEALLHAPDHAASGCLDVVIHHATHHFAEEDRWMSELDFPARQCHMDEHAAVLRSASAIRRRLSAGDHRAARSFAQQLAAWFPAHVQYLDSALATWICKLTWDAKPLVFRGQGRTHAATLFV